MARIPSPMATLPAHSAPVDKAAAREMRAPRGEVYTTPAAPELCPVSIAEIRRRHAADATRRHRGVFTDLTGTRRGAMVVLGLINYEDHGKSRWSARCDCGMYEMRVHSGWKWGLRHNVPDACHRCVPDIDERKRLFSRKD